MRPIRILVTAGPTREPIDPIRFITNYSTGAMGYAIAKAAKRKRHRVVLISGPTYIPSPKNIKTIKVVTARQMFEAIRGRFKKFDCVIMAAAVSDFRPLACYKKKLKRKSRLKHLRLERNPDILYWLSRRKANRVLVGFCMETEDLLKNARTKLRTKRLDIIVANRVDKNRSAFGEGKTNVVIIEEDGKTTRLNNATKEKIAGILLDKIEKLWYKRYLPDR